MTIADLEPKEVWKHFYALTRIPRPSKKEKAAADFVVKFGKGLGLETIVDSVGNVIIRKPATKGMENRKGIILQGHLDMVPQKNANKVHDFEKDPIETRVEGEWVKANGTTLGADNGLGVAAAMAVLESKTLQHGPVEALFTIDEETGMTGAFGLKPGLLKGDILINLDSETEGELYVGCAGGLNGAFTFTYQKEAVPQGMQAFKLSITGFKGGHSGMDIILGRGNANKTITRCLNSLLPYGVRLAAIDGGSLRNAIPREAFATILVPEDKVTGVKRAVTKLQKAIATELAAVEPDFAMTLESTAKPRSVMDDITAKNLIAAVYGCPNGVIRMSDAMPGLVETSTNLAIVKSNDGKVKISCLLRSSVDSAKVDLADMMGSVFKLAGAKCEFTGGYPGWKPNMDSAILKTMEGVYQKLYKKTPAVMAIHAGLECGLLGGVYPNLDMVSFGPTIMHPHSPDEKLKVDTVGKFWNFLSETLKNAPANK